MGSDFNPRSREGSDREIFDYSAFAFDFNPRSREGSDVISTPAEHGAERISIHAPARGATKENRIKKLLQGDFNPRSREGSDRGELTTGGYQRRFQSTLPRGERLKGYNVDIVANNISIHAPAKGATIHQA